MYVYICLHWNVQTYMITMIYKRVFAIFVIVSTVLYSATSTWGGLPHCEAHMTPNRLAFSMIQ